MVGSADRFSLAPSAQLRRVVKAVLHPQYSPEFVKNDVALLKLDAPVELTEQVVPACVDDGSVNYEGAACWATGFGVQFSGGLTSAQLYQVQMSILTAERCSVKYPATSPGVEVCAGDNQNKDTCQVCAVQHVEAVCMK
jgi:hypothetical protein